MEAIWVEELPSYETLQVKVLILALTVSFPAFIVSFLKSFPQKNPTVEVRLKKWARRDSNP